MCMVGGRGAAQLGCECVPFSEFARERRLMYTSLCMPRGLLGQPGGLPPHRRAGLGTQQGWAAWFGLGVGVGGGVSFVSPPPSFLRGLRPMWLKPWAGQQALHVP